MKKSRKTISVHDLADLGKTFEENGIVLAEKTAEIREVIGDRKTTEKTADPLNAALSGDGDAMTTGSSSMNLS